MRKWDRRSHFFFEPPSPVTGMNRVGRCMPGLTEELLARLHRLVGSEGMELLAVEVGGTPRRPRLCLVLDRPEGGVTLGDCEIVSRQASLLLDEADPFPGSYTLEVSSPGLDRKLYGPRDWERFRGRAVRVRTRAGGGQRRVIQALLVVREGGFVRLRTPAGEEIVIPEAEIFEARLDPFLEERLAARAAGPGGPRRQPRNAKRA